MWLLQNNEQFSSSMAALGTNLYPSDELYAKCEEATCILYSYNSRARKLNHVRSTHVNKLRSIMFGSGTSDPERLPPCQSALRKKVMRANYQAYLYRNCLNQSERQPSPNGHGWIIKDNHLEIDWMDVQPAPNEVLAMTCCGCKTDCHSNRCGCFKHKMSCTGICSCKSSCRNRLTPDSSTEEADTIHMRTVTDSQQPQMDSDSDVDFSDNY